MIFKAIKSKKILVNIIINGLEMLDFEYSVMIKVGIFNFRKFKIYNSNMS